MSAQTGTTRLNGQFTLEDYTAQAPTIQATLNTNRDFSRRLKAPRSRKAQGSRP